MKRLYLIVFVIITSSFNLFSQIQYNILDNSYKEQKDYPSNKLVFVTTKKYLEFKKTNSAEVEFEIDRDTKIPIYAYRKDEGIYVGRFCNKNLQFKDSEILFSSEEDKECIIKGYGNSNLDRFRKSIAYDKQNIDNYNKMCDLEKKREQQFKKDLLIKQIFLLGDDGTYIFSDDYERLGYRFHIFNCFKKDIKYVYITLAAYNQVDDLQRDDLGKCKSQVTCIGPIYSHESSIFEFENLFWDSNDIISYLSVTSVTIQFFDGTKKIYSGNKNVKNHYIDNPYGLDFDFENSNIGSKDLVDSMPIDVELCSPSALAGIYKKAEFPGQGGDFAFWKYIEKNIRYPQEAKDNGIQGEVVASYSIDVNGKICDISIVKSVHPLLDDEAKRLLILSPRFKPAENKYGDPVKSSNHFYPFYFKLQGGY